MKADDYGLGVYNKIMNNNQTPTVTQYYAPENR